MEQNEEIDKYVKAATGYFEKGYNCSQSVFLAFAGNYGVDEDTAAKISLSFGAGMGRLREVCGAVTGMFMVMGLHYPATDVTDKGARTVNYTAVQRTAAEFKSEMGSYICAELLNIKRQPENPTPCDRNPAYYAERPCLRCVATAAAITAREILKEDNLGFNKDN